MEPAQISTPLDLHNIQVKDGFWTRQQDLVTDKVIPYQWNALNDNLPDALPSYSMHNFRAAARIMEKKHRSQADVTQSYTPPVYTYRGFETLPEDPAHPDPEQFYGYVFQDSDSQLFLSTVEEDVAFGPKNYGLSEEEVEKRVTDALEKVHITGLRRKSNYKLSGGEKKLAAIATILSMEPDIIIMDEPSIALDPRNRRNLIGILDEIKALKIITSHDLDFVMDTCERVVLLDEGRIIADGPSDTILKDKELLESHGLELPLSLSRR